jgi:hypothetical protein
LRPVAPNCMWTNEHRAHNPRCGSFAPNRRISRVTAIANTYTRIQGIETSFPVDIALRRGKNPRRRRLRRAPTIFYSVCSSVRIYSTTDSLQPSMCVHLP